MKQSLQQPKSWLQIFSQIIKRFSQDLVGVLFISIAIITLLSLMDLTEGALAATWSNWLLKGFGLGRFLFVGVLGYLGFLILFRHLERFPKLDIYRISSLEICLLSILPLLSIFNGQSIERAHQGLDGGIVGWGLARILIDFFGFPFASILLSLVFIISISSTTGLFSFFINEMDKFFSNILTFTSPSGLVNADMQQTLKVQLHSDDVFDKNNHDDNKPEVGNGGYIKPSLEILLNPQINISDESFIHTKAIQIEKTLEEFGVPARVAGYRVGPTIIQYAVEPGFVEKVNEEGDITRKKVRVSQISALNRDLSLALSVERLRIEAPIPGHSFVGIEIPNQNSTLVRLKQMLLSDAFTISDSSLRMALGLDVSGNTVVADLARMPHLLVAGTTGSGKSVFLTSIIACLVFNNSPKDLNLVILDPKMVELVRFNGLPHLLGKVETQIERMLGSLTWAIKEMENRIQLLESVNARDLDAYNLKMSHRGKETLPKIVILIDELADLMMSAPEKTESSLVRLAQIARATGIHLVIATQRPSTDIITGLIKANFPARISFMTASSIDSRVILDSNGAENLMGNGDLLFLDPEKSGLTRAQGVLIDDREIENIISFWQNNNLVSDNLRTAPWEQLIESLEDDDSDGLIKQAIELVRMEGRASTSRLQRKLRIGFPRAARLMDELEQRGIVGPIEGGGRERNVLPEEDLKNENSI